MKSHSSKPVCIACGKPIAGRSDKKYCSPHCRTDFHNSKNFRVNKMILRVNQVLKKNRAILMGYYITGMYEVPINTLSSAGFNFTYFTSRKITSAGIGYFFCYEVGYSIMDNKSVIIVRVPEKNRESNVNHH